MRSGCFSPHFISEENQKYIMVKVALGYKLGYVSQIEALQKCTFIMAVSFFLALQDFNSDGYHWRLE